MAYEPIDPTQAREIINFQISYNNRKVKATWGLAAAIIGMFLLEEYFGGSQNISVLVRMGANVGERVREGEYYRMLSSVFLHAGFMHVFFNTYVLVALGGFFNRILGESKYLVIFFVSGIAGSLSSVYLSKSQVSVGASGAIWGLFGTSLALALFRTSLVPEPIRLRLRRITFINLIINLLISFLPMIDMWAHIGGGLAGFLISIPLIFRPRSRFLFLFIRYSFWFLAWVFSLLYTSSIAYGLYRFEPWVDQLKGELVSHALKDVAFSVSVPQGLKFEAGPGNTVQESYFTFGDPQLDSLIIELRFVHEKSLSNMQNRYWIQHQTQEMLASSSIDPRVKKTIFLREKDNILYFQQFPKNESVVIHNYISIKDEYVVKLGIMVNADIKQHEVDGLADRIIETIKGKNS